VAPLLPKLRGHFAEFLNKGYPVRLRILSSPTCVGLRYGHLTLLSSFSRQREIIGFATCFRSASGTILSGDVLHYLPDSAFAPALPATGSDYPSVSLLRHRVSVVLEYPPVVHRLRLYVLGLGPDLPWADEPSPGILRFSTA